MRVERSWTTGTGTSSFLSRKMKVEPQNRFSKKSFYKSITRGTISQSNGHRGQISQSNGHRVEDKDILCTQNRLQHFSDHPELWELRSDDPQTLLEGFENGIKIAGENGDFIGVPNKGNDH